MNLNDLLRYDDIVIQCHNNPDADALASGLGLLRFFKKKGKKPRFVYGGEIAIHKSDLVMMTDLLRIDVQFVNELSPAPELLIYVDCQRGGGYAQLFPAQNFVNFDHHKKAESAEGAKDAESAEDAEDAENVLEEIRPYRSCATLIWKLTREADPELIPDKELATALYYGLFMDSRRMTDQLLPEDEEMRQALEPLCDKDALSRLKSNNLSRRELELSCLALQSCRYDPEYHFALTAVGPWDDNNLLGIVSDNMISVDENDVCVAFSLRKGGAKFSVRSCTTRVPANELAGSLAEDGGGRSIEIAGGFLSREEYDPTGGILSPAVEGELVFQYFWDKMREYFAGNREHPALTVEARIDPSQARENVLAAVTLTLGGCITVEGARLMHSKKGDFVSMPFWKDRSGQFHDVCYPCTADMSRAITQAVLDTRAGKATEPDEGEKSSDPPELSVKIFLAERGEDSCLARASVMVGGCFVINGIRVIRSDFGEFASMPRRRAGSGKWEDICFAVSGKKHWLQTAVLDKYREALAQNGQRTAI